MESDPNCFYDDYEVHVAQQLQQDRYCRMIAEELGKNGGRFQDLEQMLLRMPKLPKRKLRALDTLYGVFAETGKLPVLVDGRMELRNVA
jgi:hypothetical protein